MCEIFSWLSNFPKRVYEVHCISSIFYKFKPEVTILGPYTGWFGYIHAIKAVELHMEIKPFGFAFIREIKDPPHPHYF